ncbi:Crp/Fnr family transcriptional regulator [Noviherbaspirillum galbum]|uniref:Crp/Fnr family transcriptional regulator n=1 Tax=Noviherbaspirillum galbum TaxID=2709383 RepID=A0A6B3SJI5_9BURK|nr:Crp/Fnr family transcriptional regulator [Noviherbaspirillum galbum]NEX60893.1 Crp/Fnr family transcriptional regulator [Noviherbaspirillum galbum]
MTASNDNLALSDAADATAAPVAASEAALQVAQQAAQLRPTVQLRITKLAPGQQINYQVQLRKIPLLAGLSDEEIERLKPELRFRQYGRREVVLQKGGVGDSLLFLLMGQMQVVDITEDGRAIGLRMLKPGDFFGEIAVINGSTRSASVVALSPVLVAFLPRQTAVHLFSHSPSVANQMLRHLAEKVQRDSEFRALLSINNTSRRICSYLELIKQKGADNVEAVENLPTHQDIANMINTSRETVSRVLANLASQGIVLKDSHRLIICKPAALQRLAQGLD